MENITIGHIGIAIGVAMVVYVSWRFIRTRRKGKGGSGSSRGIVKGRKR